MFKRLTQIELEESCATMGLEKLLRDAEEAEAEGRASGTFYAKELLNRFVGRMSVLVEDDLKSGDSRRAHVSLVKHFDPRLVAYIAVANCLNMAMAGINEDDGIPVATLRHQIGVALYNEHFLQAFEMYNKELFHTLTDDLNRRRSQNARHHATVMKMQARKNGVPFYEWSATNIHQVGDWCVDLLVRCGMIELHMMKHGRSKERKMLHVTDEVLDVIIDRKKVVSYFRPRRTPFVERPLDWPGLVGGGYHTKRMQNTFPRCIKATPTQLERIRCADISIVTRTINALQSVGWAINQRILAVQKDMFRPYVDKDKPEALACHAREVETWSDKEKEAHVVWKRQMAKWYTEQKLGKYESARTAATIMMAEEFSQYPEFFFMYFADWRYRYYPVTSCVSPQGPDNQKALLQFSEGMPLTDEAAVRWFLIHGTSKWGYDKTDVQARIDWVKDNHELILACAADPVNNRHLWSKADKPYQFLAWCFEYSDWMLLGPRFLSYLPISMDGSCNGLQNYSAMGRDPIGAAATNLLPGDKPSDIYQMVADVTTSLIRNVPDPYARLWLEHGINRKVVKRCVMTLPYGAKKFSFTRFIQYDYLAEYRPDNMTPDQWKEAASFLGEYVWKAIGMVVVQAIKMMAYFQKCSRAITAQKGVEDIWWPAPNGAPVTQAYYKVEYVQCRSRVAGTTKLNVMQETDRVDKNAHCDGISPNIIHCCDSSHLSFTVLAAVDEGLRHFAMIHDDYGTHAANTETLARLIREQFVEQYKQPVFERIADCLESQIKDEKVRAEVHAARPALGDFDVTQVLDSTFFFI